MALGKASAIDHNRPCPATGKAPVECLPEGRGRACRPTGDAPFPEVADGPGGGNAVDFYRVADRDRAAAQTATHRAS